MTPEGFQKIGEIFSAARELRKGQRASYLDEACAGDLVLRAKVEELLAADEQAEDFLGSSALAGAAQAMLSPASLAGQTFSHFHIIDKLGAGGMGEVWRARDLKLNREVAIKMLPGEFAQMPDRIRRFEQEARAASALNHPNIITIFEIGETQLRGQRAFFMATELVEGRTLRAHVKVDPPTLGSVLEMTIQIASALAAAHEAGIIHRDMKPDNVMVRRDGLVKVLDFGLAKLTEKQIPSAIDTDAATLAKLSTEPGAVMGTPQYMSPEQARGQAVDARSDIFSLGVILYEMLAGVPPFEGVNALDVISAILRTEPPALSRHLPEVPRELERLVEKTLRKDREQRYQTVKDLLIDLKDLRRDIEFQAEYERKVQSGSHSLPINSQTGSQAGASTGQVAATVTAETALPTTDAVTVGRFNRHKLSTIALLCVALPLLVLAGWWFYRMARRPAVVDLSAIRKVELAKWRSAPSEDVVSGSFSPDGKLIAYNSSQSGGSNIWFKLAAAGDSKPVTNDEFMNLYPVWSPNGDELAFFSQRANQNGLWRVPASGGTAKLIKALGANELNARLRSWSKRDLLYYETNRQLWGFDLKSGQAQQVARFDNTKAIAGTVSISTDEKQLAWASTGDVNEKGVWVRPVQGGTPRLVSPQGMQARNTLWHPDNERVLFSGNVDGTFQVFIGYADGQPATQLTMGDTNSYVLDISQDGKRVLLGTSKEEADIWGVNVATRQEFPFANDLNAELWPAVAPPTGKMLVWQTIKNLSQGDNLINGQLWMRIEQGAPQQLDIPEGFLPQWSPDGQQLAFLRRITDYSLWVMSATGGAAKKLPATAIDSSGVSMMPYNRLQTADFSWSPDSKQLAYGSVRQGISNLWLASADGSAETQLTTNSDATQSLKCPLWSTDGQYLAYTTTVVKRVEGTKQKYSLALIPSATRQSTILLQSENFFRLIGWTSGNLELLIAGVKRSVGVATPSDVELSLVSVKTGAQRKLAVLPAAYLYNIQLAADRKTLAFAAHRDDKDDLWLLPLNGSEARKLTDNPDPRLFFSGLTWSPDGQEIYFSKQLRHSLLSMLTGLTGAE